MTEGSVNPHDVLAVSGEQEVQNYLITEVQKVYRMQGVDINDKHIEVIVRQMMTQGPGRRRGRYDAAARLSGGTRRSSKMQTRKFSERIAAGETDLSECDLYRRCCLVSQRLPLATDSFLSAASFQETTRVLTEAAIKGKVDPLMGLKENVIIGKLVPAGTGMTCYSDVEIVTSVRT